jgi:hypothetical protein
VTELVYCSRCGTENDDDAERCVKCDAPLREPVYRTRRRRYEDDLCFGGRGGIPVIGILFGLFIVIWGLSNLVGGMWGMMRMGGLWPLLVILLGLFIVINGLSRR